MSESNIPFDSHLNKVGYGTWNIYICHYWVSIFVAKVKGKLSEVYPFYYVKKAKRCNEATVVDVISDKFETAKVLIRTFPLRHIIDIFGWHIIYGVK